MKTHLINNTAPSARGPASAALLRVLTSPTEKTGPELSVLADTVESALETSEDLLTDDDLQLTLYLLYLLHYGPAEFVDGDWEWNP